MGGGGGGGGGGLGGTKEKYVSMCMHVFRDVYTRQRYSQGINRGRQ